MCLSRTPRERLQPRISRRTRIGKEGGGVEAQKSPDKMGPLAPILTTPGRRKMVEMVEMAEIGIRTVRIYYMLGLSSMPILTGEASTLPSAEPKKDQKKSRKALDNTSCCGILNTRPRVAQGGWHAAIRERVSMGTGPGVPRWPFTRGSPRDLAHPDAILLITKR